MADAAAKLITVVLDQDGTALDLLRALRREFGCVTANVQHARGTGSGGGGPRPLRGYVVEKEILTVVVPAAEADVVFAALYERAGIGTRHGGFMYQAALGRHHPFRLPDLPDET